MSGSVRTWEAALVSAPVLSLGLGCCKTNSSWMVRTFLASFARPGAPEF